MSPADPRSLPLSKAVEPTIWEAAGGGDFFTELVDGFYDRVEVDPLLLSLYPDVTDLAGARRRLALFLEQYFGGPAIYSEERGHPRLRARHLPFAIGARERDHWLRAMHEALNDLDPEPRVRAALERYFDMAAEAMVNQEEDAPDGNR